MIEIHTIIFWASMFVSLFFVIFWLMVFLEKGIEEGNPILRRFPLVSVAIPAYNEEKTILETLKSVLKMEYPKDKMEVIVINDGSKDNTRKLVEEFISSHKDRNITLVNQENKGKGASLNIALKRANGEFFTCLDADSYIGEDALQKMLPVFDKDRKIATVLPFMKVKNPNGFLRKIQWCEYLVNFFYKRLMSSLDCVQVAPGPFSVYRKKILDEIGGFSENNLTEDLEISLRLQKHNYKLVQLINVNVYTTVPNDFKGFYKQRNRWYKGSILNILKYREMLFNRKYGDFGMLQMPKTFIAGFFAVVAVVYFSLYYVIKPLYNFIRDIKFIEFDFLSLIKNAFGNFVILDINLMNVFLFLALLSLAFLIIKLAYKYTREKVFTYGYLSLVSYLVIYGFLASVVWFVVFFELVLGRTQKW